MTTTPGVNTEKLTAPETAEVLGVQTETLKFWRWKGVGPRWFRVGQRVFYLRRDLDTYLAAQYAASNPDAAPEDAPLVATLRPVQ